MQAIEHTSAFKAVELGYHPFLASGDPLSPKTFVLDTNVVLHDSNCIFQFDDNNVVIPMPVLEELDRFKKGNDSIHFHAREFVRTLDELAETPIFKRGVSMGEGKGKLIVAHSQSMSPQLSLNFQPNADHLILNCAYELTQKRKSPVILVTKDVNLRMKAKSVGVKAEDYSSDKVKPVTLQDSGIRTITTLPLEVLQKLTEDITGVSEDEIKLDPAPISNEYFIFKKKPMSVLATFDPHRNRYIKVDRQEVSRIRPRNAEQCFSIDALTNPEIPLVALSGKAGTGKTLLALAAAIACEKVYEQIFLSRPVVPMGNRDIGYLPGDIDAKMDPYIKPLFDNLGVIQAQNKDRNSEKIQHMLDSGRLKISPLAFIRGRSLVSSFFIVDEAQNLTPHEVKTIVTRAGEGTKIVLTGDVHQIDHPYLDAESNGLSHVIEKLKDNPLFGHVRLQKGERSELAELGAVLL